MLTISQVQAGKIKRAEERLALAIARESDQDAGKQEKAIPKKNALSAAQRKDVQAQLVRNTQKLVALEEVLYKLYGPHLQAYPCSSQLRGTSSAVL